MRESAETVMNPSVADTKRYNLMDDATDAVNGIAPHVLLGLLALPFYFELRDFIKELTPS